MGALCACGVRKKNMAIQGKTPVSGEVNIAIPCAGFGVSNKDFFRVTNSASSSDMAFSRDKALANAKTRLSSIIQSRLKSVFLTYRSDRSSADAKEYQEKVEAESRDVVNQILSDVNIICEKVTKSPDKQYNTYVAIETNRKNIYNTAKDVLTKNQRLRLDYDEKKFREVFDKEMKNLDTTTP